MNTRLRFQRLNEQEFDVVVGKGNSHIREAFLDGLVLIDDLLCEFAVPSRHSRFDENDIQIRLTEVDRSLKAEPSIQKCVSADATIALQLRGVAIRLRDSGEPISPLAIINRFLEDVAEAYSDIAGAYPYPDP